MNSENQNKIFEILRQRGLLSGSLQKVMSGFMSKWGVNAFRAVVETHVVEESKLADILAEELKLPRLTRVRILNVKKEIFEFIPYELALENVVFPFDLSEHGNLHVVFADPSCISRIEEMEKISGRKIEPFVGEHSEIIAAIQRHYPLTMQLPSLVSVGRNLRDQVL